MKLDSYDRRILAALQEDASFTSAQLSEMVRLSGSQCSRRKAALESAGYIEGYGARLNAKALGFRLEAIVRVNLRDHSETIAEDFDTFLSRHAEVQEAVSVSGDADYILRVRTRDLEAFADFIHRHLLPFPHVAHVRSDIVLQTLKENRGLPVVTD